MYTACTQVLEWTLLNVAKRYCSLLLAEDGARAPARTVGPTLSDDLARMPAGSGVDAAQLLCGL